MLSSVLLMVWMVPASARDIVDPFTEADDSALFRTQQRVVTVASRYAQTVDQAPSIVTVVTDREIRSQGFRTVSDVLRSLPGIYVTVSKESRDLAWFRGVISDDNNKFLLLVDGVPWYDGAYTHAFIDEYLSLDNVRQIEVIKGPGSAIYGTNAFAGVVNVVTYGARDLDGGFARVIVGDHARAGLSMVAADMLGDVELRAHARVLDMDGDGLDQTPKGRVNVTGTDPRRAVSGGFALKGDHLSARYDIVDYRHTYFVNEQDDPIDVLMQSSDEFSLRYLNQFFSLRYTLGLGTAGHFTPHFYAQRYDNPGTYAWLSDPVSTLDGDKVSTQLQGTLVQALKLSERYGGGVEFELHPGPAHTTVGGMGVDATHIVRFEDRYFVNFSHEPDTTTFGAEPDAWIQDLFIYAQHTWTVNWWFEATGGLRADYHSAFGLFPSPRAGLLFVPTQSTTVKLLYGRAFRAPTARELLVKVGQDDDGANLFTNGNPDLRPEVIDTVEAEILARPLTGVQLRVASFASQVSQEIDKSVTSDPVLGDDYYANLGGSDILGVEAEASYQRDPVELAGSASLIQAVDRDTSALRYGFPPLMGHLRATWSGVPRVRLSVLADVYGSRPRADWTPDSGLDDGAPYGLIHAAIATDAFADGRLRADLSVRNLLDNYYTDLMYIEDANATTTDADGLTVPKYPHDIEGDGRSVVMGLEYRF